MSQLANQQQFFAQLMFDTTKMHDVFSPSSLSVEAGLDVYRNNLKLAWRNAIKTTFPVLTQLLGDDGMALLARDYVQQHPSQSGDLNHLGAHLPAFIGGYAPLADYSYLPDVAALEWLVQTAHDAANHTPLQIADLMRFGADEWLAAQVEFAPSAFLWCSQTAAATIWLAHQVDGDLSALQNDAAIAQAQYILVSRPLWRVEVRVLDAATYDFLTQLLSGMTFEQAFEYFEQKQIEFDFTTALAVLLDAGVWSRINL